MVAGPSSRIRNPVAAQMATRTRKHNRTVRSVLRLGNFPYPSLALSEPLSLPAHLCVRQGIVAQSVRPSAPRRLSLRGGASDGSDLPILTCDRFGGLEGG